MNMMICMFHKENHGSVLCVQPKTPGARKPADSVVCLPEMNAAGSGIWFRIQERCNDHHHYFGSCGQFLIIALPPYRFEQRHQHEESLRKTLDGSDFSDRLPYTPSWHTGKLEYQQSLYTSF